MGAVPKARFRNRAASLCELAAFLGAMPGRFACFLSSLVWGGVIGGAVDESSMVVSFAVIAGLSGAGFSGEVQAMGVKMRMAKNRRKKCVFLQKRIGVMESSREKGRQKRCMRIIAIPAPRMPI